MATRDGNSATQVEFVPAGFANRLKQVIAAREEHHYEFYRHFDGSPQQISSMLGGKVRLRPEVKARLREVLGERAFEYAWGTEPVLNPAWCRPAQANDQGVA